MLILPRTNDKVPMVGFGTANRFEEHVYNALKAGVRFLDCAQLYANEDLVGSAVARFLKETPKLSRKDLFVGTKIWCQQFHDCKGAVVQSLKDLQMEYVDLVLLHWPMCMEAGAPFARDKKNDLVSTWRQLEKMVEEGLVRNIGLSNFDEAQMMELMECAKVPIAMNQIEAHLHMQQHNLVDFCHANAVHVVAWGPLDQGKKALVTEMNLGSMAKDKSVQGAGISPQKIALKFLLQRGIAVIPSSTRFENVKSNLSAGTGLDAAIDSLNMKHEKQKAIIQWGKLCGQEDTRNSGFVLTPEDMEALMQLDRKKRRAPDLIGIWPATANTIAIALGVYLGTLFRVIAFFVGGVDIVVLRRWWVCRKNDQFLASLKKKE
eukprot:gnl/MRDRNA2_/MRDRNA2_144597_c0_seq1.p1 gnl/MRDRNA2_/MRDRNA2_144597_c0~~gnl/MRDRNA2_/MRDRNA2_144597_c0_seq1.p1  ORF type:complete len:376 (+),score=82.12 gnl/MRDRNA2_/MRDRNA2_144597_c0_seq1:88-1215(+)